MLDKGDLTRIYDIAARKVREQAKHMDETHEQFLARCWVESLTDVVEKHGYNLSGFDDYTNSSLLVTLPGHRR